VPAPDKDDKILAVLRREPTARSVTQEKLADLNIRTIQKIESGSLNVLIATLIRIQCGLGCKWDKLLPPTG
jgi:transcriptional regulator with XRE-family HTH domain